ncbi:hypothetical protein MCOR25_004820 [Pyricularia grisea]|uniref:C2H2-type domain-containing protein n=1 Tax=Pyricularia grisea TaxID=148305 RepID=A0A6P8ARD1_PYRGI|nr:uncharacterized protein PgNI_09672 [Pyricularia grisea]KAI6367860.1 hypothetical protein MCOR25_004820 [Pyricularia grisea]TLD04657.1 hypothetical protein PgNI_09672 [Pyricularia grisea]
MDLPPPLTRSPVSPPNSYSPSDRSSSIDYPSPELVAQHYSLSLYGSSCSMASSAQDPDHSHTPLDSMGQQEWAHVTSQTMPSIVSATYDGFGGFGSAASFGQPDVYASHQHQDSMLSHSPPPPHSRSPVGSLRGPLGYTSSTPMMLQSMTPRIKVEAAPLDYRHGGDMTQYPSPARSLNAYPADVGVYSTTVASSGYLSDTQSSAWSNKDYNSAENDSYYSPGQSSLGGGAGDRHKQGRAVRPLKKTKRTTTSKEDANFFCEVKGCGKMFSRSYNYKAHMETHDEKREYPFPCQTSGCTKRFVRKTDLQRHHQSVHMKERNHKCDYCGRLFARKDTLRRHMEDGCPKRFDIGTLDLRAESYCQRPVSSDMGMLSPTHSTLPPLAMPSMGSSVMMMAPARGRDILPSNDQGARSQGWGR